MSNKTQLFGIDIDVLDMNGAVHRLRQWIENRDSDQPCQYVVTPNVDHAVLFQENSSLRKAYEGANMVLADGHPIVWTSMISGKRLPERVAGSELVPRLFDSFNERGTLKVFLLGAADGLSEKADWNMKKQSTNVETVGVYSPPLGFEKNPEQSEIILEKLAAANADVVIVGLGAPKQEIWVSQHSDRIPAAAALCVGATIDFLAGEKVRAPVWMQRSGIEWLHRMCSEPKRLAKRYARDAWIFPQLVLKQLIGSRASA